VIGNARRDWSLKFKQSSGYTDQSSLASVQSPTLPVTARKMVGAGNGGLAPGVSLISDSVLTAALVVYPELRKEF
jgi:hypothetical protein